MCLNDRFNETIFCFAIKKFVSTLQVFKQRICQNICFGLDVSQLYSRRSFQDFFPAHSFLIELILQFFHLQQSCSVFIVNVNENSCVILIHKLNSFDFESHHLRPSNDESTNLKREEIPKHWTMFYGVYWRNIYFMISSKRDPTSVKLSFKRNTF